MDPHAPSPKSTAQLLELSASGSAEASEQLAARVLPYLSRVFRRRLPKELRGRLETADLVQEGLLRVLQKSGQYKEREGTSPRRWITRVVRNTLNDLIRHHQAVQRAPNAEDHASDPILMASSDPEDLTGRLDEMAHMILAVMQLASLKRQLIERYYFEGQPVTRIAEELGVPEATLRRWHKQALNELRIELVQSKGGDR